MASTSEETKSAGDAKQTGEVSKRGIPAIEFLVRFSYA